MTSQLPTFPRIIFTIVEPISLTAGALGAFLDVDWFISSQTTGGGSSYANSSSSAPSSSPPNTYYHHYDDNARLVALQLGNLYALLCAMGIAVLWTTSEPKVVRNYLVAAWLADVSHVGLTCWLLGWERSLDVAGWNAMTWGNVGFTTFLFLTRTAWFLGLFGPSSEPAVDVSGKKKKAS